MADNMKKSLNTKLTRRDFLKLSAMLAGSLALSPVVEGERPLLRDLAAKLNMEVGASVQIIDRWMFYEYPEYSKSLLHFSVLRDGMASWPSAWMETVETYEYLTQLGMFTKKHDMGLGLDNLFHPLLAGDPKMDYLKTASRETMDEWMKERVRKFFALPYFTDVQFANEAMGASEQDPVYWNDGILYHAYGKEWPELAYHLVADEAVKTGRKVGEDFRMIYHTGGLIEVPNSDHSAAEYEYLTGLKKKLSDRYGLARPFAIGMEYHIHTGPLPYFNGCWGPGSYQLRKNELIEHFQRFDEIGDVYINEFSIAGTDDPDLKKEVLHTVLEAAIESKACGRFFQWQPFYRDMGDPQQDAYQRTCITLDVFDKDHKPGYMFEEIYSIFESYTSSL